MKRPRILLADDDASMLESMGALLAPHYEVTGMVADGRALVEATLRLKPDVIVADITMPHLNGIQAARQIAGGRAFKSPRPDQRKQLIYLQRRVSAWLAHL